MIIFLLESGLPYIPFVETDLLVSKLVCLLICFAESGAHLQVVLGLGYLGQFRASAVLFLPLRLQFQDALDLLFFGQLAGGRRLYGIKLYGCLDPLHLLFVGRFHPNKFY